MTATEAMNRIEHPQFTVRAGLANSFRVFLRNISSDTAARELLSLARSEEVGNAVLQRILFICNLRGDFRYLNRYDIPLATYLWILSRTHPNLALAAANAVVELPRTWWADQSARYVLSDVQSQTNASLNGTLLTLSANTPAFNASSVTASTSIFLPGKPAFHLSSLPTVNVRAEEASISVSKRPDPENQGIVLDSTASGNDVASIHD